MLYIKEIELAASLLHSSNAEELMACMTEDSVWDGRGNRARHESETNLKSHSQPLREKRLCAKGNQTDASDLAACSRVSWPE